MANGDDSQNPQEIPSSVAKPKSTTVSGLTELGQAIETLFGPAPAAPGSEAMPQTSGGTRSIAGPMPGGAPMSARGAMPSGQLPQAPQPTASAAPPPPGVLQTGTPMTAGGATTAGAMSNIFGALNNMETSKKNDNIQHAQFLYNMMKTAYDNGDEATANVILGDSKNRKLIEKYLTGNLPKVPGKPTETTPPGKSGAPPTTGMPMQGKSPVGQINQPGGPAMPRPGPQQQMQAMIANMMKDRVASGDPRGIGAAAGPEQTLSPEDYQQAVRQQYGIDLTPAQIATMDANTKQTLITAKADVLKYVVGKTATAETALATAKIHAGATVEAAGIGANARMSIAKDYRNFLLKIKGTATDKIDQATYSGMMGLYSKMANTSQKSAEELLKAGKTKEAKPFLQEAKDYAAKAEDMRAQYKTGEFLINLLKDSDTGKTADPTIEDKTPDSPTTDSDDK